MPLERIAFAVGAEVLAALAALAADKAWSQRLNDAKSPREARQVVFDFCRAKGFEVVEVPLK